MAQRRGAYRAHRITRRLGLNSGASVAAVLVALTCLAGGVGIVGRMQESGVTIEREDPETEGTREAPGDGVETPPETGEDARSKQQTTYVVHVDGAVAAPGVVRVEGSDVRVFDAVEAAGGLLDDADTSMVNLAESLVDGAKIHIPHEGETMESTETVPTSGQASTVGATGVAPATTLVNLNTATSEELQTLPGIGEVTAQTIIDERDNNGPFASPEDLMRVSGIGEKKFEKVRGLICV